jgi:hypothetical protein
VKVLLHGLDSLLCVHGCGSTNDDSLETRLLNHLLVVIVQGDSMWLKVDLGPSHLLRVGSKGSDELSAGSAVEEVDGMSLAHAAEASSSNLEFLRSHC